MDVFAWGNSNSQFELILNGIGCSAAVNVSIQGTGFFQNFTLQQGEMVNLPLPSSVMLNGSSISSRGVIVISSNSSISVISKVSGTDSYEWSYVYPVDFLDVEYYVITPFTVYLNVAQFAILSLDQETSVTVTLSGASVTFQGKSVTLGIPMTFSLSPYQVAQFQTSGGSFSGTFIQSNKPIAVLSGNQVSRKPLMSFAYTFEQLLPVTRWGKSFVVPPLSIQLWKNHDIMVMASQATNLEVSDGSSKMAPTSLSGGEMFAQAISTKGLWIDADQTVMVMYVCYGTYNRKDLSLSPFMSNVMATTELETSQVIHAPSDRTTKLVVTISGQISDIIVDGISLPQKNKQDDNVFKTLKYSWTEVTVSPHSHNVQQLQDKDVWVMSYSFTETTASVPTAGSTSSSFNFYGSDLTCQVPQDVSTSPYDTTTPSTTSLFETTTPSTTSLYETTTPSTTTSLYEMTTPTTTSLNKMTTSSTTDVTTPTSESCQGVLCQLYLNNTALSWWDALRYCRQHYTDLISVPDSSTQNRVATLIGKSGVPGTGVWIGLRKHRVWGYLYWKDGQPIDYMNWGDGEPSDPFSLCTHISPDKNFTWNDQCCDMKLSFICY